MEKIKVNMSPNPLDVQTIHASQNDGEARQWEFELHNNGELIDTSEVTEQMVFKSYKGGTEQILPENGSTPTTSPFKGDIKYPQGLLTDQEFLYRESPTEEDGLAKITDIKGNTLVWNQLVQNGNFADTSIWQASNTSFSVSSNVATIVPSASYGDITQQKQFTANHKYFATCELKLTSAVNTVSFRPSSTTTLMAQANTNWQKLSTIFTVANSGNQYYPRVTDSRTSNWDAIQVKNVMLFDLTQMGLDSVTADEFTSLFPLPYYAYNQGTLLSFNGNGIKTVGFNQWDEEWEVGAYNSADGSKADNVRDRIRNKNPIRIFPSVNYYKNKGLQVYYYDANMNFIGWSSLANQGIFTPPSNAYYMNFNGMANSGTTYNNDICINISSSRNGEYEPYTSSTLSLPISTYFPTGMKSAGSVYDELTENKAITRVGSVDLGTLRWTYSTDSQIFTSGAVLQRALTKNGICAQYDRIDGWSEFNQSNKSIFLPTNSNIVRIKDPGYTDATAFKSAMSGVYLYCELATESETSFTTASLVTENAEIPLSNEDGILIGKCTEELSAEPGFHDAKIKLSDADGECYSNKIQLHIERSPQ